MCPAALQATTGARQEEPVPAAKLVAWAMLVGTLIVLGYASKATSPGGPASDLLYRYSTAIAAAVQYAVMLAIAVAISRGLARQTLGFRRPRSWPRALALTLAGLGGIWASAALLNVILKSGREQGLLPDGWDSARAGAYIANFIVIAIVAPVVEETVYRGLGFAAVSSFFGAPAAIVVTGVAFGLSHGLVVALPVLSLFGMILAALRWRTRSLYPPIILHALFNAAALVAAVTLDGGGY